MKILHTSDWHIGHQLYGHERAEDHAHVFNQIAEIVAQEKPDAMVVSGDVFHTAIPTLQAQKQLVEYLISIQNAHPGMTTVVTAGNHDGQARLAAHEDLWKLARVKVVGAMRRHETAAELVDDILVDIDGKGWILALPYTPTSRLTSEFFADIAAEIGRRNTAGRPVVYMAHATVRGCNFRGHDNASEKLVGGLESVSSAVFGDGYDYLALGHIHVAQTLNDNGRIRYSGTPLAINFDEPVAHTVSIVEIGDDHSVNIREVPLSQKRPLVTIGGPDGQEWDQVKEILEAYMANPEAAGIKPGSFVRLNVSLDADGAIPADAENEARQIIEGAGCHFCLINAIRKDTAKASLEHRMMTVSELQQISPLEIAKLHYMDKFDNKAMPQDLQDMFTEVMNAIANGANEESE